MWAKRSEENALSFSVYTAFCLLVATGLARSADYYVSPAGSEAMPGTQRYPFATLAQARDAIRELPHPITEDITVWVGGGTYAIDEPIVFGPGDGGTEAHAVTYRAVPGHSVLISGGCPITGWVRHAGMLWKTRVPGAAKGAWLFRYLWADGCRLTRARQPNEPHMWQIAEVSADYRHVRLDADLPAPWNLVKNEVELVLETEWTNARDIVDRVTGEWLHMQSTVGLVENPNVCAKVGNRAFLENAYEFVDQPGEWYLDRETGTLYCCLAPGVDPNSMAFVAPRSTQLLKVAGTREHPVMNLHFRELQFAHTDWHLPEEGYAGIQACYYAAGYYRPEPGKEWPGVMLPLAIQLEFTQGCSLERCTVRAVASNGLGLSRGCLDTLIQGCEVADSGANGLMVGWIAEVPKAGWYYWWSVADMQPWDVNRRTTIANCYIHDTGRELWEGVGLLEMFAQATRIVHNEFSHTGEAGMVIGFCWDPVETPESDTLVEANDVHHFCEKLGDNGGIYTLGFNANAVIRDNFIHHNLRRPPTWLESPAFGLYYDQASKNWTAENNVLYLVQTPGFARSWNEPININVTQRNTISNNYIHCHDTELFRFTSTPEDHLTQEGNVVLTGAADLEQPAVRTIIQHAGIEPEYRDLLRPAVHARMRHRYTFDNPAERGADSAGHAPMALDHGPYTWSPGATGKVSDSALELSGASGVYGAIDYDVPEEDPGDQFSLVMWISPAARTLLDTTQSLVANAYPGTHYVGFFWTLSAPVPDAMQPGDCTLGFLTSDGASETRAFGAAGDLITDGRWHHVAVVVDKATGRVRCYADGNKVIDSVVETYFGSGREGIFVGGSGRDHTFRGAMDDIRIYSGLLTKDQIVALSRQRPGAVAE